MRQRSTRPILFGAPALIVMGVLAVALLYVLHPREELFDQLGRAGKPDALSLAYLSVLQNSDSDNQELRLRLAQMQSDIGQPDQALQTLQPLLDAQPIPPEAARLALSISSQKLAAAAAPETRLARKADLIAMIGHLVANSGSQGAIHGIVEPILNWLTPEEQMQLLPLLIASAKPEDRLWFRLSLGHAQLATGDPAAAAETLELIIDELPSPEQPAAADELVRLYLASGQPEKALATFRERLLESSGRSDLHEGIRLARLAGDSEQERRWLEEFARGGPVDIEMIRRLRNLQWGDGDLGSAAATAQQITRRDNANVEDREWAARMLEWQGQPEQALAYWQALYLSHDSQEALTRSISLARDLFLWPELVRTLELARTRGDLNVEGYRLLGDGHIRAIELDKATEVLEEGLARYPGDSGLVDRLYQLYVNNYQYPDAISLLENKQTLSEQDRLLLANLYWRTRNIDAAVKALATPFTSPDYSVEAQQMRLDLLTMLGDPRRLREEYLSLMSGDHQQLDTGTADRLIGLAAQFGDYDQVTKLASSQLEMTGEQRYVPILADAYANSGRWSELAHTLDHWQRYPAHDQDGRYWVFRGRLHEQRRQPEMAERAYRQALFLSPGSEDILSAWGWLLVARPGDHADKLGRILAELASLSGQRQYSLLAYGYSALGQDQRSRFWLQQLRSEGNSTDWLSLKEQASLAEHQGNPSLAFYLRQLAARQQPDVVAPRTPPVKRNPDALVEARESPLYQSDNRALQAGWQRERISGLAIDHVYTAWDFSAESYRVSGNLATLDASNDTRFINPVDPSSEGSIELQNNATDWLLTAGLGTRDRIDGSSLWSKLELSFRPARRWQVTLGQYSGERATDSAEAWWLIDKDRTSFEATYQADSRTLFGGRVEALSFDADSQSNLARGQRYELFGSYTLARSYPDWTLRGEYVLQDLNNLNTLDNRIQALFTQPLNTGDLLTSRYERVSAGMRWQEQDPHSLLEQHPQPGWYFDVSTGYVLSTDTIEYGLGGGMSWSIAGHDELALSAGYSSDSLSGDSTLDARLTYTLFFSNFRR